MARLVESVAVEYEDTLEWEKVMTNDLVGAKRYLELTNHLGRPAPVPSIFINSELVFKVTPSIEALKGYLDDLISKTA
jgi:hypothetical protein